MRRIDRLRNIGISAHIDSGKTTLTERILYYTGKIRRMHEVRGSDGVGAEMDSHELEREKGITIRSAATHCVWNHHEIQVIDTPGHVDFTIEVERALRVLDGAIIVLDSVAGVQSQSITVDRQMKRYRVPRLAFINKMDRPGADALRVTAMLEEKLGHNPILVQLPLGSAESFEGVIDLVTMRACRFRGEGGRDVDESEIPGELAEAAATHRSRMLERLAVLDDEIAESFLEGREVTIDKMKDVLRRATLALEATPVFVGSALKNKGVQQLLDGVVDYLPSPSEVRHVAFDQDAEEREVVLESVPDRPLVALAFKLDDSPYGQLTYLRIYQGSLRKGDTIHNCKAGFRKVRVSKLMRMHADKGHEIDEASAGDIVALHGIEAASGDTLTSAEVRYTMTSMFVPEAVISLAVSPRTKEGQASFSKAVNRFTREDPTLRVHLDVETGQTIFSGMGELHLEIYLERMRREYACETVTGRPRVAYRETITGRARFDYTHKKQTGGPGQFARVVGMIEPLPADAVEPFEFVDEIVGGAIPREFVPSVEKGFREATLEGAVRGFPVVGVRVTLTDGGWHATDSSDVAFRAAAIQAFRQAFREAGPAVLEPVMSVEIEAPAEFQGTVMGQIHQRRGVIVASRTMGGTVTAAAQVPLAEMFGYSNALRSATQGKGEFSMELSRYALVPRAIAETLEA